MSPFVSFVRGFSNPLITAHQGSALRVLKTNSTVAAAGGPEAVSSLQDPNKGKDGKGKSRPMNKTRRALVGKDSEEGESNSNGSREVTLGGVESICGSSSLKEEQGKEDKDFSPNAGLLSERIITKCLEERKDDQEGRPAMVKREWQMDEKFISNGFRGVMLLDNVVNVSYCRRYEKGEDEGNDIMTGSPEINIDGIQDTEERETPGNTIDDDTFSTGDKLVDDGTKEENVDDSPNQESPRSRSEIGFFAVEVDVGRSSDGVDIRTQKQNINNNVYNLEEDTIGPRAIANLIKL
jgi:hypothetical protein